jgi:hypothetical protein
MQSWKNITVIINFRAGWSVHQTFYSVLGNSELFGKIFKNKLIAGLTENKLQNFWPIKKFIDDVTERKLPNFWPIWP